MGFHSRAAATGLRKSGDALSGGTYPIFFIRKSDGKVWVCELPGEQCLSDCILQVEDGLWCGVVFQ